MTNEEKLKSALSALRIAATRAVRKYRSTASEDEREREVAMVMAAVSVLSYGVSPVSAAPMYTMTEEQVTEAIMEFSRMRMLNDPVAAEVGEHVARSSRKGWHDESDGRTKKGSWCLGFFFTAEEEARARMAKQSAAEFMKKLCASPRLKKGNKDGCEDAQNG